MKVTFPSTHNAFQVTAPKGTMISFSETPTEVVDGVYVIGDDGSVNIDDGFLTDTIYLSVEGEDYTVTGSARVVYPAEGVTIRAGSSVLPFKKKAKGGDGGGSDAYYQTSTDLIELNGMVYEEDIYMGYLDMSKYGLNSLPDKMLRTNYAQSYIHLANWLVNTSDNFVMVWRNMGNPSTAGQWPTFFSDIPHMTDAANATDTMQYNFWSDRKVINLRWGGTYTGDSYISYETPYDYDNYWAFIKDNDCITILKSHDRTSWVYVTSMPFIAYTEQSDKSIYLFNDYPIRVMDCGLVAFKVFGANGRLMHDYIASTDNLHAGLIDMVDGLFFRPSADGMTVCRYDIFTDILQHRGTLNNGEFITQMTIWGTDEGIIPADMGDVEIVLHSPTTADAVGYIVSFEEYTEPINAGQSVTIPLADFTSAAGWYYTVTISNDVIPSKVQFYITTKSEV